MDRQAEPSPAIDVHELVKVYGGRRRRGAGAARRGPDDRAGRVRGPLGSTGAPVAGFGLIGMRERAGLVAGTLDLTSEPGAGTRLEARLPLRLRGFYGSAAGPSADGAPATPP